MGILRSPLLSAHLVVWCVLPPRIIYVSGAGKVEVKKGYSVTLECKADGNPVPNITWTRKNNNLPGGEYSFTGNSLTVRHTNRHSAGVYLCTASNMVGSSAAAFP
ncbi:hypothetical protein WDU94_008001 [Cyamophila willieti]